MNAEDLHNLYSNLRGNRSAQAVLDAEELFVERKMGKALEKLTHARDAYQQSRSRLLRQPPESQVDARAGNTRQQAKRIERKQQKALDLLETFEKLIGQLEKLAQRERDRSPVAQDSHDEHEPEAEVPAEATSDESDRDSPPSELTAPCEPPFATPSDVTQTLSEDFQRSSGEDQLDVISVAFGFREVTSTTDIHPHALYLIRTDEESFSLAYTRGEDEIVDNIYLENAAGNKPLPDYSRSAFVALGTDRRMVLLTPKSTPPAVDREVESSGPRAETESEHDPPQDAADGGRVLEHQVLDMGSFSQLMDSAQRSGILPGADQIAHVRDREFQRGEYDLALQLMEAKFATFTANANQRAQRLTQEEADISSGRVKMSPKQLQAKRSRDRMQTQAIERARNRFQRVLDGLRILLRTT